MSNLGGEFKNALKSQVGTTWETIYTAPDASVARPNGATSYIIELDIASTGNTGVQVSVQIHDSSGNVDVYLIKNAPVPQGASLKVVDGQKIVLEPGDSVKVKCETQEETVDVVASLVEGVNL